MADLPAQLLFLTVILVFTLVFVMIFMAFICFVYLTYDLLMALLFNDDFFTAPTTYLIR